VNFVTSTRLALANLRHYKARTAVAIAGVAFAVLLVFMQLGFLGAVAKTATIIYDALDFDIVLRSPAYLHLTEAGSIPESRLLQARSLSEIASVRPFMVGLNEWQNPVNGQWRGIMAMGVEPLDAPFLRDDLLQKCQQLTQAHYVLADSESRAEYGPAEGERFSEADKGVQTVLGRQRVEIVGAFSLGTGLGANGAVLQSVVGYQRSKPGVRPGHVSMGLVTLREGAAPREAADALQSLLGAEGDTQVLTRREVMRFELDRWIKKTSLGTIFQLGVGVALLVGVAIVYQVLSTDVVRMIPEYATLKAIGYRKAFLSSVVLQQAVAIGILGFVPGLAASLVGYRLTSAAANIPVVMNGGRIAGVFALAIVMCAISGGLALRKLHRADPAELY
jgi:putative ABC transport system permease protein